MGIAPDPMQYPDSWYITRLNRTLESHTTLYQYIINHQMQADSIAQHLGTQLSLTRALLRSYEHFARPSIMPTIKQYKKNLEERRFKLNLNNLDDVVKAIVLTHAVVEARVVDGTLEEDGLPPQVLVVEMGELEGGTIIGSLVTSSIIWMMQVMNNLFEIVQLGDSFRPITKQDHTCYT